MKQFFILGRNPKLSKLELTSFLNSRKRKYEEDYFNENILILKTKEDEKFNIDEFGGIIKIGKILFEGQKKDLKTFLEKNDLIEKDKFSYSVLGNTDSEILKEKFKAEKRKATQKHGKLINFQNNKKNTISSKTDYDFLILKIKNNFLFGIVNQKDDFRKKEYRDMNKPVRRESLAISPRLSIILINLSGAKPGKLLLDPFCGVGGILQESLLKKIKCHGIDLNKEAVNSAKKNLDWIKKEYKINTAFNLENKDSKKTPNLYFDAIATETPLTKLVKKKPSNYDAQKMIKDFESFIIPIFKRLKQVKRNDAKIAITFPKIRNFRVDHKKIESKTSLKVLHGPITESRPDQFISRDIFVFE